MIGVITAGILLLRIALISDEKDGVINAVSHLTQFFTILTNILVMVLMFRVGSGRGVPDLLKLCVVVAIAGVGILYHLLLAHLWSPEGLVWLTDQGVHTVVPVLTIVWWAIFAEKTNLTFKHSIFAIIWPFIYTLYALTRAQFSGFYPYPFLNWDELGSTKLTINISVICVGFFVLGVVFIGIARIISARHKNQSA
ncbi:MAG: Pr6Pr family membrane protein [Akkermansiaceae bacterium]